MKNLIRTLFFAFVISLMLPFSADAAKASLVASTKGGDTVRISAQDGKVEVSKNAKAISSYISNKLNDTVLTSVTDSAEEGEFEQPEHIGISGSIEDLGVPIGAIAIVGIVFGSIFLIVVAVIVGSYMHRRQKYRLMEKAIENNYPMPEGVFTSPSLGATRQNGTGRANWSNMRSGIAWCAWGAGIALFFLISGGEELASLGIILLIIGIGRLVIAYKNNQYIEQQGNNTNVNNQNTPPTPPPFGGPNNNYQR